MVKDSFITECVISGVLSMISRGVFLHGCTIITGFLLRLCTITVQRMRCNVDWLTTTASILQASCFSS